MGVYQFHPHNPFLMDSFHSSVSRLHARTALHFFRYTSSIPTKKQFFCTINKTRKSGFTAQKTPHKRFNLSPKSKNRKWDEAPTPNSSDSRVVLSRCSWLDNWNVPAKQASVIRPPAVVDYRNRGDFSSSDSEEGTSTSSGGSTMERIIEKLKKFGYMDDVSDNKNEDLREGVIERGSIEDIFSVEEGLLPNTRGGFSEKFPFGDGNVATRSNGEARFPWEKKAPYGQRSTLDSRKSRSLAQLTLPESELRRLTNLSLRIKNKTKIGGAGVTQQVVETIHEKWKSSEVVRLKVEGAPALNMRRMHEILEVNFFLNFIKKIICFVVDCCSSFSVFLIHYPLSQSM